MSAQHEVSGLGPDPFRVLRPHGWALAYLVARRVEPGEGSGVGFEQSSAKRGARTTFRRISAREFARRTGTTHKRIMALLDAWNRAAADGLVPRASELTPGVPVALPDDAEAPFYGQDGYYRCYQPTRGGARCEGSEVAR